MSSCQLLLTYGYNTPMHLEQYLMILTTPHYLLHFQHFNSLSAALGKKTKHLFYANIMNAYISKARSPLYKLHCNLYFSTWKNSLFRVNVYKKNCEKMVIGN
ncbi:hypothetical protein CHARACLAT_027761 [Characodon lateralis]|uniref:Uncharacterized protein n=1 Tax=Characodon lateralis TaxID=208331 RepID=A0ABU7DUS1_9TELE|nr:hypothetical protein [Characodon lateralis]